MADDDAPWDPANGFRVGGLTGGLVGGGIMVLLGSSNPLIVLACGALGGLIGYRSQKRRKPDK